MHYCSTHAKQIYKTLQKSSELKPFKLKNLSTLNFDDIKFRLMMELENRKNLLSADYVVIENQPSLKNPQMKSIQMILYSYFLILGKTIGNGEQSKSYIDKIDFCSATNKLKVYDGPEIILEEKSKKKKIDQPAMTINEEVVVEKKAKKGSAIKYADKKRLAIEHAKYFLLKQEAHYLDFFNTHKKKDDLADSFLQGVYYCKKM
jgi:hypothetical protein